MKHPSFAPLLLALVLFASAPPLAAIGAAFTFQGFLADQGQPAEGMYDLRFTLQDGLGQALGAPVEIDGVPVSAGVFTVQLDFGVMAFNGDERRVGIEVSRSGEEQYVSLAPAVPLTATPYSLRTLDAQNAELADAATLAADAALLGGLPPAQFVQQDDARLANSREPVPGSPFYLQNQNAIAQSGANFRIDGTGRANILGADTQFNLGAARVLSFGNLSVHLGLGTAQANTSGNQNVFVGWEAGRSNTTGSFNSFLGLWAGRDNTTGTGNNFYGSETGRSNVSGCCNSFFGGSAGFSNQTGSFNTFVGERSAQTVSSGDYNTSLGANILLGANGLQNATAIGARASVTQSNSLVLGAIGGINNAPADTRVGIGTTAPKARLEVAGGDILLGAGRGLILTSPDGTSCVRLVFTNDQQLLGELIACP
jgi:hypothetical protein